jgi:hypothetical protein
MNTAFRTVKMVYFKSSNAKFYTLKHIKTHCHTLKTTGLDNAEELTR